MYGEGISRTGELLSTADLDFLIQKQGLGILITVRRLAQGSENAKKYLTRTI